LIVAGEGARAGLLTGAVSCAAAAGLAMVFINRLKSSRATPGTQETEETAGPEEAEVDLGVVDPE
jgi:hypothetical protein